MSDVLCQDCWSVANWALAYGDKIIGVQSDGDVYHLCDANDYLLCDIYNIHGDYIHSSGSDG